MPQCRKMQKWWDLLKFRSAFFSQTNLSFLMGCTVHPVIVSFAPGTMLGVLGVKITKNICDESASHRKGVVKIDPRNSIPSWWWCFTSPFTESTRWLSILALLLTAPHHPPPRADAELFSLRFWSQADSASFLWKDEMSACQKAKVPRTAITEIWRAPKFKSNVMLVHWA